MSMRGYGTDFRATQARASLPVSLTSISLKLRMVHLTVSHCLSMWGQAKCAVMTRRGLAG